MENGKTCYMPHENLFKSWEAAEQWVAVLAENWHFNRIVRKGRSSVRKAGAAEMVEGLGDGKVFLHSEDGNIHEVPKEIPRIENARHSIFTESEIEEQWEIFKATMENASFTIDIDLPMRDYKKIFDVSWYRAILYGINRAFHKITRR